MTGGAGNDMLTGGSGADRYLVVGPGQATLNIGQDTITDFAANDVIDLTSVAVMWLIAQVSALLRQEGAGRRHRLRQWAFDSARGRDAQQSDGRELRFRFAAAPRSSARPASIC